MTTKFVNGVLAKFDPDVPRARKLLAEKLGHRHVTTISGWQERGRIPSSQMPKLLAVARDMGVSLSPADLIPVDHDLTGAR